MEARKQGRTAEPAAGAPDSRKRTKKCNHMYSSPMMPPDDLQMAIEKAWERARDVPGFLAENEFRALAMLAVAAPSEGALVEIGSFKGKSTLALASVAARYGLGRVVSIDPHTSPAITDASLSGQSSSYDDFLATLRSAGLEEQVEIHRAMSHEVGQGWNRSIRLLWIDGDHTYAGAKEDFDLFAPHLTAGSVVALHDTLHPYEGPIRVFVEDILQSDDFGPAGFVHSLGWAQYRPSDGGRYRAEREKLARRAARLIPYVSDGRELKGFDKQMYKLRRWQVPHTAPLDLETLRGLAGARVTGTR